MKTRQKVAFTPLFIPLESISVASPCNADWNAMHGDDRARFCSSCAKNVYNLSALTKTEAEALLLEKEGNLCVRYFQRPDGTLLTQDCPIGLLRTSDARLQPQFALWANATALAMLVAALITGALAPLALQAQPYENTPVAASPTPTPSPISEPEPRALMGDVAVVPEVLGQLKEEPTPTPTPQIAVPRPAVTMGLPLLMGKVAASPSTPKPTPVATPTPHATMGAPMVLGRIARLPLHTPKESTRSKTSKPRP